MLSFLMMLAISRSALLPFRLEVGVVLEDHEVTDISGTTSVCTVTLPSPSRESSVEEEEDDEAEEEDRDRFADSCSSCVGGTVSREEYFVLGAVVAGREMESEVMEGIRRGRRSYPGTKSSENGTVTGVGLDLAEFSRRK